MNDIHPCNSVHVTTQYHRKYPAKPWKMSEMCIRYTNLINNLVCLCVSLHKSVTLKFRWEPGGTTILTKPFSGYSWHHGTKFRAQYAAEQQPLCRQSRSHRCCRPQSRPTLQPRPLQSWLRISLKGLMLPSMAALNSPSACRSFWDLLILCTTWRNKAWLLSLASCRGPCRGFPASNHRA